MRSHRRQRGRGVMPPDPGGEWRLLGLPPDNSIGSPRPARTRMTDAQVDRPQFGRTRETVAYCSAELNVRIHSAPAGVCCEPDFGAHPTARLPPHMSLARDSRLCDGRCNGVLLVGLVKI